MTLGLVALAWAIGMFLSFHPMILSGFERVQTGSDTRFLNYVLEHSYLWVTRAENYSNYWHPTFFYPAENCAAYGY